MKYNFRKLEQYWQHYWKKNKIFYTKENKKKKFYILNMFPYPSGSGLHIGHCLCYIASDIYARYLRGKGFNVLNPMGFDSFGLPTEQYAIQTGKHPHDITYENEKKYQNQINSIGISFDWNRKLSTSNPNYYRWTQWMFIKLFNSWYDKNDCKAKSIKILINEFNKQGNISINANSSYKEKFDSKFWIKCSYNKKEKILHNYRLAYLCNSLVNWCPELNTVLSNEEIKNGKSIRGDYPIYKKTMLQWHIRISAYADRLIRGLNYINCSESLKKAQINWIGKSISYSIMLEIVYTNNKNSKLECIIDYPEFIFGITFIVLSIDHPILYKISHINNKKNVFNYINKTIGKKNKENISAVFTGNYVIHPFTKIRIPIYISDFFYFNNGKRSLAIISEQNEICKKFSKKLKIKTIPIISIDKKLINSYSLNGLNIKEARLQSLKMLKKIGQNKINYKIRDAIFSRQRYWGEPIPIYFKNNIPKPIPLEKLPLILPKIKNNYSLNTKIDNWAWHEKKMKVVSNKLIDNKKIFPIETDTMPSWAGSSWYFLRYMDVNNNNFFLDSKKENYWKNVDLYIGGSEHSTGHLIYSRFWNKFLKDICCIKKEEPFIKIINQGMILCYSACILKVIGKNIFVSYGLKNKSNFFSFQNVYVDVSFIKNNNILDICKLKKNKSEFKNSIFVLEKGNFLCKRKLEKMSKSKYNIVNPEFIIEKYGADVFRIYEMFLGPITQSKLWDEKKINGISNFIKKFWNLFHNNGVFTVVDKKPTYDEFSILHETIKNINKKMNLLSFNTCISSFMIIVNKLSIFKCNKKKILVPLLKLISPFSPHIAEELWKKLGYKKSIIYSNIPNFNKKYIPKNIKYLVMLNGIFKFVMMFNCNITLEEIKMKALKNPKTKSILKEQSIKKIMIIKKKIINILF